LRIDVHTHFQSLDFIKHLLGRSGFPRSVREGGTYVIQCASGLNIPGLPKIIDIEKKLRDMEDMKIDVAALSHGLPFGPDLLGCREADEWATRINDDLARIIAAHPGKFVAFGSLGFGDPQRSIAEVDRCAGQLGFSGFQVFSNISNRFLDSPEFLAVLKHIAKLGMPVHLHPAIPLNRIGLNSPRQFFPLGLPYDTTLNVVRLIESGLFDETPDLKLIVAHAGGVIPYLWGRISTFNEPSPLVTDSPRFQRPIDHYLSKLYVDTVCYRAEALQCCNQAMGADHLLYGTDHPFARYDVAAELIEKLDCPASDRELIYHGNAERLLRLQHPAAGSVHSPSGSPHFSPTCPEGRSRVSADKVS
jgi:predicted TIM-barrel fold metal-dependent hydrolase